jgi:hypothetical protein
VAPATAVAALGSAIGLAIYARGAEAACLAAAAIVVVCAYLFARQGRGLASVLTALFGLLGCIVVFALVAPERAAAGLQVLFLLVIVAAVLAPPTTNLAFGCAAAAILAVAAIFGEGGAMLAIGASDVVHLLLLWGACSLIGAHLRKEPDAAEPRTSHPASDPLAPSLDETLASLRVIVPEVLEAAQLVGAAASQIAAMMIEQERGAAEQAKSLSEARENVEGLVVSSLQIGESSQRVLENAESTLRTSQASVAHLSTLRRHTERIDEVVQSIRAIASKSEILALNAALEGIRAGEAGRGFSMVASEVRVLSERTTVALDVVRTLTEDIGKATRTTVASMEQTTELASGTTGAAREITSISERQKRSADQVLGTMGDVAIIAREFASGAQEVVSAIQQLERLSGRLETLVLHLEAHGADALAQDALTPAE